MNGITANDGVLTLDALTPEAISAGMISSKTPKGLYAQIIMDHVESGDAYYNVSGHEWFANSETEALSITQSLKSNIAKLEKSAAKVGRAFPKCAVSNVNDNVVLVNVAAHFALVAAQNADNADNDES